MVGIAGHLLRRGLAAVNEQPNIPNGEEILRRLQSSGAIATLVSTGLLFILLSFAIEYSVRFVMGNLAIVEDVQGSKSKGRKSVFLGQKGYTDDVVVNGQEKEALLSEDYIDMDNNNETFEDVELVRPKPITRSLRTTKGHLQSVGGRFSQFRGFKYFAVYAIAAMVSRGLSRGLLHRLPFGLVLADIISVVATCRLRAVWTHATISAPSTKTYRERILPRAQAKHLILPSIRTVVATRIAAYSSCVAGMFAKRQIHGSIYQASQNGASPCIMNFAWLLLPMAVALFTTVFFIFPTTVALVRVEASLIPESDEVIVPFDRTFGGRINWNPSSEDEDNAANNNTRRRCRSPKARYFFRNATMGGAWRTMDAEAARRVMKLFIKFFFISVALTFSFAIVFAMQIYVILGDQAELLIAAGRQHAAEFRRHH